MVQKNGIKVLNFKSLNRGAIQASFDLDWHGMSIRGMTLMQSGRNRWVNYPSQKYEDAETGETKYYKHAFPTNPEQKGAIEKYILKLVDQVSTEARSTPKQDSVIYEAKDSVIYEAKEPKDKIIDDLPF